jgi:hypothetical protein
MAGALDSAFKSIAKQVVADLGSSLDTTITYTRRASPSYNTSTGVVTSTDTSYASIKVPIEFIKSEEDDGRELRQAKIYITPDLIGNNQPTFEDEVILSYAGGTHTAQIVDIDTRRGGQVYLHTLLVRF